MNLIIATAFLASAADGALSTLRVGPRKAIRGDAGFEFGRPVDVVDADAAFQEMKLIQRRFLQGGASYINDAGASFPLSGMSLPYPGMSIPYPGMSIPYPGMSLPYYPGTFTPSPSMAPADSTTDLQQPDTEASANCVGQDLTASTQIHIQLDIDSLSMGTSLLDVLAQSIVSFGEAHFSLCHNLGNMRLLLVPTSSQEQERNNAIVTGLDATASSGNTHEMCSPAEEGAYCTVVDVVLTVYSPTEDSSSAAEQQVYDEVLVKQVDAGTFVNGEIVAIRFHPKENRPTDTSAVSRDWNQQAPTGGADDSSTVRTIVISVMVLVAVAVLVGLVIRKRMANRQGSSNAGSEDTSNSDGSSSVAGDDAVPDSLRTATANSRNVV